MTPEFPVCWWPTGAAPTTHAHENKTGGILSKLSGTVKGQKIKGSGNRDVKGPSWKITKGVAGVIRLSG